MKKILVPVDFTEVSDNAIDYAIRLAEKMTGEIRLLHAVDDPFFTEAELENEEGQPTKIDSPADTLYKIRTEARIQLEKLVKMTEEKLAAQQIKDVTISHALHNGLAEDMILEEAARFQPQLILMGSHGHPRLDRVFFGSVTQGVIRNAHFPVLAIPVNYTYQPIKELVYMTDLNDDDIYSISKLIGMFKPFEIKLHVAHFSNEENKGNEEEKMFYMNEQVINDHKDVKIEYEVIDARILRDAYQQYIEAKHINLIALTTRKLGHFKRFFNPGTAVDALYHSHLPLLVFHKE